MWLVKLVAYVLAAYVAVVALLFSSQTWLLFPTWMVPAAGAPPAKGKRLDIAAADGSRLKGLRLTPQSGHGRALIIGFGGNAWNAEVLAAYLHQVFPDCEIVAFHYRGYRPSGGQPGAAAMLSDAPLIYDGVVSGETRPVVAVGFSLGTAVAVRLASSRPLAGTILVTPFDSLLALGRDLYPWVPVRWMLRHRMEPAAELASLSVPVAVIVAAEDTIIPPRRAEPLRKAARTLVFDRVIAGAGHNDVYGHPAFGEAMGDALTAILRVRDAGGP